MMRSVARLMTCLAVAAVITVAAAVIKAQPSGLAFQAGTGVAPARYLTVDDELIDVEGLTGSLAASGTRPEGATVDSDFLTGPMKFSGGDAGIIPVEFDPPISQARRDLFMQYCNGTWGSAAPVSCIAHTSQFGFLHVTQRDDEGLASTCHSSVGQARRLVQY